MTAPFDTIQHGRAGRGAKASPSVSPSCSAALDANRKGRRHCAFSRGHHVHVVSNQPKKGFSTEPCPAVLTLPPVDWRRFARRPFTHSHRPEFSSLAGRLVVERAFPAALAITNSRDHHGSRRSVVHSATRQHASQCFADVVHSSIILSKPSSLAGSNNASKRFQKIGKVCQTGGARD